jgi:hypothetical protein
VVLEVRVQKYLDSSLIDVDVHPTYVSMVIKSKVGFPAFVYFYFAHRVVSG